MPFGLIQRAFGLKFRVASCFAGSFFDGALGLIGRAVNAIFIHFGSLSMKLLMQQQRPTLCLCPGLLSRRQTIQDEAILKFAHKYQATMELIDP